MQEARPWQWTLQLAFSTITSIIKINYTNK